VVFAFGTANWGTGTRHKTKFFPGMVLVVAVHMTHRRLMRMDRKDLLTSRAMISRPPVSR